MSSETAQSQNTDHLQLPQTPPHAASDKTCKQFEDIQTFDNIGSRSRINELLLNTSPLYASKHRLHSRPRKDYSGRSKPTEVQQFQKELQGKENAEDIVDQCISANEKSEADKVKEAMTRFYAQLGPIYHEPGTKAKTQLLFQCPYCFTGYNKWNLHEIVCEGIPEVDIKVEQDFERKPKPKRKYAQENNEEKLVKMKELHQTLKKTKKRSKLNEIMYQSLTADLKAKQCE